MIQSSGVFLFPFIWNCLALWSVIIIKTIISLLIKNSQKNHPNMSIIFISCFVIAGEMMSVAEQFLEQQMHPTLIISAYQEAMEDMLELMKEKLRSVKSISLKIKK